MSENKKVSILEFEGFYIEIVKFVDLAPQRAKLIRICVHESGNFQLTHELPRLQYFFEGKCINNIIAFIKDKIGHFTNSENERVFDNPNLIWDEFEKLQEYNLIN